MKQLLIYCAVLFSFFSSEAQQSTFYKSFQSTDTDYFYTMPASDNGWYMLSESSIGISKFNSCGQVEWAKKYLKPDWSMVLGLSNELTLTQNNEFAFLLTNLNQTTGVYRSAVVKVDELGNILWSKEFKDTTLAYYEEPNSLIHDNDGNFYMFQYLQSTSSFSAKYCSLTKISHDGNVIWSNVYQPCINWGAAIYTSDNNILMRSGNTIIKIDTSGMDLWSTQILSPLNQNYWYFAPVEVSDGYIFYGINANGDIIFIKLDINGQLQWNGAKKINLKESLSMSGLSKKYNGNFVFIISKAAGGGKYYTTWTEFDKDLNVVNQGAMNKNKYTSFLEPGNICFTKDSASVFGGMAKTNYSSQARKFILKADKNQHFTCDSTIIVTSTQLGVVQNPIIAAYGARTMISYNFPLNSVSITESSIFECSNFDPVKVNLGSDTNVCEGVQLFLKNLSTDKFDKFQWSTGELSSEILVDQPGTYWLKASNSCTSQSSSDTVLVSNDIFDCEALILPNVITPNQDAFNNEFVPIKMQGINTASIRIYNRWGQQVFSSTDLQDHTWDGTSSGKKSPSGVYYWVVNYTNYLNKAKVVKGMVTLFAD